MRRYTSVILLVVLVAGIVVPLPTAMAASSAAPIRLKADTFRPGLGQQPDIPPGLTIAEPAAAAYGYYLVQFTGPVQVGWRESLEDMGAEILAYVPEFAYKVRMAPGLVAQVKRLDAVNWVGVFQPAYRLSPDLDLDGTNLFSVRVERGADAGRATAAIARSGAEIVAREGSMLTILADAAQLGAIAHVADVAWVQNFALQEKHNEYGAGVIMGADVANGLGYDGSTQTVAVADTGLGSGTENGAHPDIPASRITAIYDWSLPDARNCYYVYPDGAQDADSGHGTHVAGSILSDGQADGTGKGTAPAAHLVFQAVEEYVDMYGRCGARYEDGYYLLGIPQDIGELFLQAYNAGARVHSDSWGHDAAGDYDIDAASADAFVWSHRDMLITTSAGNAGVDGNSDGYVDSDSMGSPATAKNILTVGASENDRGGDWSCDPALSYLDKYDNSCSGLGGSNELFTYGDAWPADFPASPVASDISAGNAEQMAAFSSRGPTDDGRIKPDVVAPGTWVLSGYSDLYQEGYDLSANPQNGLWQYDGWGFPLNSSYKYMGGTSMSNPLTAGGAAVVRDYYQQAHGHAASAALVKATLINTAVDILDENNDGADDNDYPIPNDHEGWGRVDLAAATDGTLLYQDETVGLSTGGSTTFSYGVTSSGTPLKVSLVWSDYPSTEAAAKNLQNDLDLMVTAPSGAVYYGNDFQNGWSQPGGSADRTNNVENVYVASPETGTWTVEIRGFNVPMGQQPFALVVDGTFGNMPPVATFGFTCSGLSCDFDGRGSYDPDGDIAAYSWDFGDGNTDSGETARHVYLASGTYAVTLTVTDNEDTTAADTQDLTVNEDGVSAHIGDLEGVRISVRNMWTAEVTVAVHDQDHADVSGALVSGTWSDGISASGSCETGAGGTCTVSREGISKKITSVVFTVDDVSHDTLTYVAGDNHDPDRDSDGTTIVVPPPANQPPLASFSFDCSGPTCSFDASGSTDADGTIVAYDWAFGDGGADSDKTVDHTYGETLSYTVVLTVKDDDDATDSDLQVVPLGSGGGTMHVGDLKGSSNSTNRRFWKATVTITIHDSSENLVEGATVMGTFSDAASGTGTCLTGADGACSITSGNISTGSGDAVFRVDDVTHGSLTYDPLEDHGPGSVDGRSIIIPGLE